MRTYLIRRFIQMIPLLLGISIISFSVMHLAPGGPLDLMISPDLTPEDIARMQERFGLNEPVHVQYVKWFSQILQGNFGTSFRTGRPVIDMILARLPRTIQLNVAVMIFSLVLAIPIGVLSAVRQYSAMDMIATFIAFFGISMPNFWLGMLMMYLFAVRLGWLPTSGASTYRWTIETVGVFWVLIDRAKYMIMPVFVLGTSQMAFLTRYMRSSMLQVIREDYVRTARAKGLAERVVVYKHAMRNALIPIVTIMALMVPGLLGGSVIIETIFSWPGVGLLSFNAILQRDYPIVLAFNTIGAVLTLFFMIVADILYVIVDPRIRFD